MATITSQISGSPLIGSPIVYQVQAEYHPSAVFHRVKMQVVAGLQGGNYVTIEMSSPATDDTALATGELLKFDISSALRAVADAYAYTPEPPQSYPYVQYYLIAWDEYMIDGVSYEGSKDYFPDNYDETPFRALMGAYSDLERLLAGENKQTLKFTRKPSTLPEIVCVGDTYIRPAEMNVHSLNIEHGQQSVAYPIVNEGAQTVGGANLFALPAQQRDCYPVRFINGLGCMESLTVRSLRQTNTNITTDQYTRAIQETFGTFSRGIAVKQNDYETWKLSSGPLDEAWQAWFIHEFLMAQWVWIGVRVNSQLLWLPCHIIPEDTVSGPDRISGNMLEVQFSLQLDITGSPLSELAI